ncbi:MAG TPA: S-adenosylmethionine decarboxylase [Burkholderiaceae bacterium]|nr:S-adenosylmethionine decarboxylase [Burkholderiaceae bacterium]
MHGLHLTADLRGCANAEPAMTDLVALRALCLRAAESAGLHPVGELFHRFEPRAAAAHEGLVGAGAAAGITGVVLLAESHLAVHTWPEIGSVTLDVYVCNIGADNSERAQAALETLIEAFAPRHVERHALARGQAAVRTAA